MNTVNKLNWQANGSHPELIDPFTNSMREIIDPEIGLNLIELGLIRDLKISNGDAEVTMILTTPFCPYAPAMMEATQKKAEEVLERKVKVEIDQVSPVNIVMWQEVADF